MASLGQELKRAREESGVTLHEIANATHIGVRFLQAIENDSYDILPGGVFNRAFVRKYAKHVNFDEEQAVRLYEEQLDEMGGEPQRRYYTGLDDLDPRPPSGNGLLLTILALIILTAGAYLAYVYFKSPTSAEEGNSSEPISNPSPAQTAVSVAATPTPEASPTIDAPVSGLRVQLIANSGQCWISVKTDKGPTTQETLNQGDVREYNASDKVVLILGNFPAVSVRINGRLANPQKLAPNLKTTVADSIVITKANYQQFVD